MNFGGVMVQRRTTVSTLKSSRLYCSASSSLVGIIVIFVCLLIFSAFMTKFDAPEPLVVVMSSIALCVGAYTGGYIASKRRRQNGLLLGVLTGIIIYCIIFFLGMIFARNSISLSFINKMIMTVICAAIGGVVGVNSKGKRY